MRNGEKLYPLDRVTFEDLEIFPCGPNKVAFTQGYYYCPILAKGQNTIVFHKIANTFNPVTERPTTFFDLEDDQVKHFYIKVKLKDESLDIDQPEETIDGNPNLDFRRYYEADTVEISDDVICNKDDIGYPLYETVNKSSSTMPEIVTDETYFDGETEKTNKTYSNHFPNANNKLNNVFYIYLCSLKYQDGKLKRLFYYLLRNSYDPSIIVPEPIEFITNNKYKTQKENNEEIILRDARGGEYIKYKEADNDPNYYIDRTYKQGNDLHKNLWKESAQMRWGSSFVDYGQIPNGNLINIGSQFMNININYLHEGVAKGTRPFGFTHDSYTNSPYPIFGVKGYATVTRFTPIEGGT